jgi:hypothetical protein
MGVLRMSDKGSAVKIARPSRRASLEAVLAMKAAQD